MSLLSNLLLGLSVAIKPMNLLFCFGGVMIGQIIGILPGLGPIVTIAVLLPFTYNLDTIPALMALSGIYYGSQFGGAISAILVNAPGTESAIITATEGYPMARKGQAGLALATAAVSSFTGGIIGAVLMVLLSEPLNIFVIKFAAPEYLALMIFAMICISGLTEGTTFLKCCMSICIGLMIGTIGMDTVTGNVRYTFGLIGLYEGISFVILAIGLFAFAEVLRNLKRDAGDGFGKITITEKVTISFRQWAKLFPTQLRASISGFFIGVLPGVGSTTSTPLAYMMEKAIDKNGQWGKGEIKGVAAGESSNNSCAIGALVPLLSMGIPGSGTTAIMLSSFMILGVQPGPLLYIQQPDLAWGLIVSFFIGTTMLLIINLPLVKYCAKIVELPNEILFTSVLLLATVGAFSVSQRWFDVELMLIFSFLGLLFSKIKFPLTPCLVAMLLGDLMEANLARTVVICDHNVITYLSRPIVMFFTIAAIFVAAFPRVSRMIRHRKASV